MSTRGFSLRTLTVLGFAVFAIVLAADMASTYLSSEKVSDNLRAAEQEYLPEYVEIAALQRSFNELVSDFEQTLFLGEQSALDECVAKATAIEKGLAAQATVGRVDRRYLFSELRTKFLRYSKTVVSVTRAKLGYDGSDWAREEINRLSVLAADRHEAVETGFEELVAFRLREFDAGLDAANTAVRDHARLGIAVGVAMLALWLFSLLEVQKRVVGPITRLSRVAAGVSRGEFDRNLPEAYESADEVGWLWRDFLAMMQSLRSTTVSREHVESILRSMAEAVIVLDENRSIRSHNPATAVLLGREARLLEGTSLESIWPDAGSALGKESGRYSSTAPLRTVWIHSDGTEIPVSLSRARLEGSSGGTLLVAQDMREHIRIEDERLTMERQLQQSSKLEAVGQLAAGIAHEINTPMQFIGDNTRFLQEGLGDLKRLIGEQERLVEANRGNDAQAALIETIEKTRKEIDYDFLAEESETAVSQSLSGVGRVTEIVRAMKEFSHPGTDEKQSADLNRMIRNATTVSRTEWKYVADLELDLDDSLPVVPCLTGPLSQTILNLVVNAAHAIGEQAGENTTSKGTIAVRTRLDGDAVEIRVEDTGCGMPEDVRARVFEPFFTTKKVGKGTGQGLSIAHTTVVKKHGGTIEIESEVGRGTTFVLRLPLQVSTVPEEVPA